MIVCNSSPDYNHENRLFIPQFVVGRHTSQVNPTRIKATNVYHPKKKIGC